MPLVCRREAAQTRLVVELPITAQLDVAGKSQNRSFTLTAPKRLFACNESPMPVNEGIVGDGFFQIRLTSLTRR
jgi:hypothetical protein